MLMVASTVLVFLRVSIGVVASFVRIAVCNIIIVCVVRFARFVMVYACFVLSFSCFSIQLSRHRIRGRAPMYFASLSAVVFVFAACFACFDIIPLVCVRLSLCRIRFVCPVDALQLLQIRGGDVWRAAMASDGTLRSLCYAS